MNDSLIFSETEALSHALSVVTALRAVGLRIGADRSQAFVDAAARCDDLYWAGRLTLLSSRDQIALYDDVFHGLLMPSEDPSEVSTTASTTDMVPGQKRRGIGPSADSSPAASALEVLRLRRFDRMSEREIRLLGDALVSLRRRPIVRESRIPESDSAGNLDLRRWVPDMLRSAGELTMPRWRAPTVQPQQVTFLLDVSGSMAAVTRAILLATAGFVRAQRHHNAFTIGTRLTRVTEDLRVGSLAQALDTASESVTDRGAGTLIGRCLAELLDGNAQGRVTRGAIVVIYSDGLDRGDPDLLEAQMRRLSRLARRIVWMNPLSASEGYEPLTVGMRRAMPYIDKFTAGHTFDAFNRTVDEALAASPRP